MASRTAFTTMSEFFSFKTGRMYETFWNSQSNLKYLMVGVWPAGLFYLRWRAETQYKYNVFIADKGAYPTFENCTGTISYLHKAKY